MTIFFDRVALIGLGLIGSSLAHVIRQRHIAGHISGYARSEATRNKAAELKFADSIHTTAAEAVRGADLVILCSPVGTYGALAQEVASALKPGAILTDVGSVKSAVVRDVMPHVPPNVHFIPGILSPVPNSRVRNLVLPSSSTIAGASSRRCQRPIPPLLRN